MVKDASNTDAWRQEIRKRILAERSALTPAISAASEASLGMQFKHYFSNHFKTRPHVPDYARGSAFKGLTVAGYLATRGELSPAACLKAVRQSGGQTYLPVIRQKRLKFAPFDETTRFEKGRYAIDIPVCEESDLLDARQMDIVLVPLVAFDIHGNRLGMGGGYYDRSFAFLMNDVSEASDNAEMHTLFLGIAHEFQRIDQVPVESWDVPLDGALTEVNWYQTEGRNSGERK